MDDRYYIDETCSVCDTECGSRLCDDCKEETERLFVEFWDSLNSDQRLYLDNKADGVYLSDMYERMKKCLNHTATS